MLGLRLKRAEAPKSSEHHTQGNIITMSQASPRLPLELLLEVLESLLDSQEKEQHRSAAYLAQSCRALRNSSAAKRARYVHALASHGMPASDWLPENLEYETEILETSKWPHLAPPSKLKMVSPIPPLSNAFLAFDGRIVALTLIDRRKLYCFEVEAQKSCSVKFSLGSAHRVISLPSEVSHLVAAQSEDLCATLYKVGSAAETETIDVWHVRSGTRYARLRMDAASHGANLGRIIHINMNSEFMMLERLLPVAPDNPEPDEPGLQVRRWRSAQHVVDPSLPVVTFNDEQAEQRKILSTSLLPSPFIAVQDVASAPLAPGERPLAYLKLYRVKQTSATLLATIPMLGDSMEELECCVTTGVQLKRGAAGLVVIVVLGCVVSPSLDYPNLSTDPDPSTLSLSIYSACPRWWRSRSEKRSLAKRKYSTLTWPGGECRLCVFCSPSNYTYAASSLSQQ